ncbi:hypothetical protein, partial [Candidatus Allofournierella merdipullorum]|uniref:hypothetical protein n=1 Tax=Candidatus Allofournierella merdipullorum TaxID=2838595 RepID=UPI003AB598D5
PQPQGLLTEQQTRRAVRLAAFDFLRRKSKGEGQGFHEQTECHPFRFGMTMPPIISYNERQDQY